MSMLIVPHESILTTYNANIDESRRDALGHLLNDD